MRKKDYPPSPLGYLLIIGIFLVGFLLLVGALQEWQVREYLRQHGTLTEATVVERSGQPRNVYIKYSFIPAGKGIAVTRREDTNMIYYSKYTDKVSVLYDPANPEVSRIADDNNFVGVGLVAMSGIAIAIFLAVRLTKDLLKLHRKARELTQPIADR